MIRKQVEKILWGVKQIVGLSSIYKNNYLLVIFTYLHKFIKKTEA